MHNKQVDTAAWPHNEGDRWSEEDIANLKKPAEENPPARINGLRLGRSEDAIYGKAADLGVSLQPFNSRSAHQRLAQGERRTGLTQIPAEC